VRAGLPETRFMCASKHPVSQTCGQIWLYF